jgi:hypothetical protein
VETLMGESPAPASRRQTFFETESVDQLVTMVLELATELWTIRERLFVLERAADNLGIPLPAAIEGYQLTEAESAELAGMRQRMLTELLRTVGQKRAAAMP